jgi:hypothetical protein
LSSEEHAYAPIENIAKSACNGSIYMTISDGYREKWKTKFSSAEKLVGKDHKYGVPKNWPITTDLPKITVFFSRTRTLGLRGHLKEIQGFKILTHSPRDEKANAFPHMT